MSNVSPSGLKIFGLVTRSCIENLSLLASWFQRQTHFLTSHFINATYLPLHPSLFSSVHMITANLTFLLPFHCLVWLFFFPHKLHMIILLSVPVIAMILLQWYCSLSHPFKSTSTKDITSFTVSDHFSVFH